MNTDILKIVKEISPLRRMINSQGMDDAFGVVKSHLSNLVIHEYFPLEKADDWEVPYGWELINAYIKNEKGEVIASDSESHLFVAAYSEPVNGWFSKSDIAKHHRSHPLIKDAYFMEHRNAYNHSLNDWGITLPQVIWDSLSDDEMYEVYIEIVKDYNRSMKVGELFVQGNSDKIISFTAHIDELCNDNLSSCAVLIEFFKTLKNKALSEYSYQLLLVPEVIGTFFYVRNNIEKVRNIQSMINLETVGRGKNWLIKQSLRSNNYIDKLMNLAAKKVLKEFDTCDIFGGYGNEERVFEYPTINIPSVALQRFPFDEYHSSADTPDMLSETHLNEALDFVSYLYYLIENDFIPEYVLMLPPWLTKHGLYFDSKDETELFNLFMNQVQYNIDGKKSLVILCSLFEIPFNTLHEYLMKFVKNEFIEKKHTYEIWKN